MCTSYKAGREINFHELFDVEPPAGEWREEVYKDYAAPIVLRSEDGARVARLATFGMVPRKQIPEGVKVFDTMNCRTETIAAKRSFSGAWRSSQLCLIPCTGFYEPSYESGKAVRWRISMGDGKPFAIAGLWRAWNEPEGTALSFTMLTVNADQHPLMSRFHKPGDEKRGVIVVPPAQYGEWLECRDPERARTFFGLRRSEEMTAVAAAGKDCGGADANLTVRGRMAEASTRARRFEIEYPRIADAKPWHCFLLRLRKAMRRRY